MTKTFIILHVLNPIYSVDNPADSSFIGPFYTRNEAAEYLADPKNHVVEYFEPDETSREPYVQISKKGIASQQNTTRRQLVQLSAGRKDGFVYSAYGDFMRIVELTKRTQ